MRKKTGMTDEVRACLAEMGVTEEVFAKIRSASNHTDGQQFLDEAKEICRKGFRAIARVYHPDQNQQLPPEEIKAKEERFKRLRSVHDSFLESRYRGPQKKVVPLRNPINFDPFGFSHISNEDMIDQLRRWNIQSGSSPGRPYDQFMEQVEKERAEKRARAMQALQDMINKDLNKK